MRPIGLTGDPIAQDAVAMHLSILASQRGLTPRVFAGLLTRVEAYHLREAGGEIWHCGPYPPEKALVGYVDRVVPGMNAVELQPQVTASLDQMLAKSHINGETHHG